MLHRDDTGGKTRKDKSFEEVKVLHEEVVTRQEWDLSWSNIPVRFLKSWESFAEEEDDDDPNTANVKM